MQTEKKNQNLLNVMQYHGSNIAFEEIEGKMMVNATQMAKLFKQRPVNWLKTQQAKDLINTLTEVNIITSADLVKVKRGGKNQGTWLNEELALIFAQWLSPKFYIACNRKLKELLQQQALSLPQKHGVSPTIHEGKAFYPYTSVMKAVANGAKTGSSDRKKKYPQHFVKLFGRNFIDGHYFDLLKGYYDYKKASNQLNLGL